MKKKPSIKLKYERIPPPEFDADVVYLELQDDDTFRLGPPPTRDMPNWKPAGIWSKNNWCDDLIVVAKPKAMPAKRKRALRMTIADVKDQIRRKMKSLKSLEMLLKKEMKK